MWLNMLAETLEIERRRCFYVPLFEVSALQNAVSGYCHETFPPRKLKFAWSTEGKNMVSPSEFWSTKCWHKFSTRRASFIQDLRMFTTMCMCIMWNECQIFRTGTQNWSSLRRHFVSLAFFWLMQFTPFLQPVAQKQYFHLPLCRINLKFSILFFYNSSFLLLVFFV